MASVYDKFLHFDLYRLGNEYEFEEIKFLEQFSQNSISCIEWQENMGKENLEKLKKIANYVPVNFKYLGTTTREIEFNPPALPPRRAGRAPSLDREGSNKL